MSIPATATFTNGRELIRHWRDQAHAERETARSYRIDGQDARAAYHDGLASSLFVAACHLSDLLDGLAFDAIVTDAEVL